MNGAGLIVILAVIVLFWGLGAHNRLMRLRRQACVALDVLLESWRTQASLMIERLAPYEAPKEPAPWVAVHDETLQWRALIASARQLVASCEASKTAGVVLPPGESLVAVWRAHNVFEAQWQRLRDAHPDLAGAAIPADVQALWTQGESIGRAPLESCRAALQAYHHAIAQFPATIVARIWSFRGTAAPPQG